jgi:hypothetical protein
MTTKSTGGNAGRVVEHVDGTVASANERGVKLAGETAYRNFSRFADPPITVPRRGARVRLGLDADGFVRQLQVLDDAASVQAADHSRDRQMGREVAIKTAAQLLGAFAQCREEVKVEHVFPLADKLLAWLEPPDSST